MERPLGLRRNDTGHCGLSNTGGPVKNHIGDPAGLNDSPEQLPLPQYFLLPDHIIQRFGADLIRQRLIHPVSILSLRILSFTVCLQIIIPQMKKYDILKTNIFTEEYHGSIR